MRDVDRPRCAIYMLRDDASLWWEGTTHAVDVATLTWARFREMFFEKYFPADVKGRLTREFMSLRQGDLSMAEFISKFDRGFHFVPMIAGDVAQKLRHFLDGLRPNLRRDVMPMTSVGYDEATTCAFQAEQALQDIDHEMHKNRSPRQHGHQKPQGQFRRPQQQEQQRPPQSSRAPKPDDRQPCPQYSRFHFGKFMWGTFKGFVYGQEGHNVADCPRSQGPTTGRAYVMHAEEAEAKPDSTLITGVATHALLDSGATYSFISESFVKGLGIIPVAMDSGFRVSIPSGEQIFTSQIVKRLELMLQKYTVHADLIVLPLPEFDIILGMDWLSSHGAVIDF
ncbi:uncharacterized protein [Primulina eburnea]|uniref:uncharacterized protein n=1 Tax=Primulina eburnea TaxID=1245227 RepID=UPI003C6C13EC